LITSLLAPVCSRDSYEKRIYAYGLVFSNFGFMGNAVVGALFPDIFLEYIIFTLPLWTGIYLWGAPVLLIGSDGEKKSFASRLKNFCNPMFVCTLIGMVIGLLGLRLPGFVSSALTSAGNCMSPVAMLLTGMTIAQFKFRDVLCIKGVYIVTAMRLVLLPVLFLVADYFLPLPKTEAVCSLVALSMPLGLNSIIIPSAYGRDTRVASGMALVSHVLSCLTIPVIFLLYNIL
jgi:predicted permease